MKEDVKAAVRALRQTSGEAYVGSVDGSGFPQIKAMFVPPHGDLRTHYFSTNVSSLRTGQFLENPRACVYYCDTEDIRGALFTGTMTVCTDHEHRTLLWNEGDEKYYPQGVDDPDYCVLKFTAETVRYYHGLEKCTLSVEEL